MSAWRIVPDMIQPDVPEKKLTCTKECRATLAAECNDIHDEILKLPSDYLTHDAASYENRVVFSENGSCWCVTMGFTNNPQQASTLAQGAFTDVMTGNNNLHEDSCKDGALSMQVLRVNLTLSTSEPKEVDTGDF
ncbi:hypothetical protein AHF37_01383 [Paragonimus kellicotti]|nr:hypothetical protein AHF37_01383 [Paragonimus kellicotti]